jgi:hypothetical protein
MKIQHQTKSRRTRATADARGHQTQHTTSIAECIQIHASMPLGSTECTSACVICKHRKLCTKVLPPTPTVVSPVTTDVVDECPIWNFWTGSDVDGKLSGPPATTVVPPATTNVDDKCPYENLYGNVFLEQSQESDWNNVTSYQ